MTQWFWVTASGEVINGCLTAGGEPRVALLATGGWKRESEIPQAALERYEFWNDRP